MPTDTIRRKRKKEAEPVEPIIEMTIPGFPVSEGPCSSGRKIGGPTKEQPVVVVLPPGAFQYVWEMLEARAKIDHPKYRSIPKITTAIEESVRQFRSASEQSITRTYRTIRTRRR